MASSTKNNLYTYVAPAVASITPNSGCWDASEYTYTLEAHKLVRSASPVTVTPTTLSIVGVGFKAGATVTIGMKAATNVTVVSEFLITCTLLTGADPHYEGIVDVVVVNPDASTATFAGGFTYTARSWWRVPIIVEGSVTGYDYVYACDQPHSLAGATSVPTLGWWSDTTFTGAATVQSGRPHDVRPFSELSTFASGEGAYLGGSPACSANIDHRIIYPGLTGAGGPPLYVFSGASDRLLLRIPPDSSGAASLAVLSMLVANGTIYLSTKDATGGRVFQLNWLEGTLTPLGAVFTVPPYALAWHMGRLWCGTNDGTVTAGKVYWFRPNIDTTWTQDRDVTVSDTVGGVVSMHSYKGNLYVGTDAPVGVFAKVLVRSSLAAWTTSLTASGGTARTHNGFPAMLEYGGNLYVTYWNNDTTPAALIKKFDNSSWSTVYTAATAGTRRPFIGLFQANSNLYVLGGGLGLSGTLFYSTNGTSYTTLTTNLTGGTQTIPAFGLVSV